MTSPLSFCPCFVPHLNKYYALLMGSCLVPLTLLPLVYEKQQVNRDEWPAAIVPLNTETCFFPWFCLENKKSGFPLVGVGRESYHSEVQNEEKSFGGKEPRFNSQVG